MFVGPVFTREITTAPRSWRLYFLRALYAGTLFGLVATAWLILFGSQPVRNLGDLARFGAAAFSLIAPVQLAVTAALAALLTAAAVAQEKDRRTLDLLLLTSMSNVELVLGKLLASMLSVFVLIAAGAPLLMLLVLLGGVSHEQVARVCGVTLIAALAAGSIGSTLALWREKTFQTLAMTALALALWLLVGEAIEQGTAGATFAGASAADWAAAISPLRAMIAAAQPVTGSAAMLPGWSLLGDRVQVFMLVATALAVGLNAVAVWRVRVWNPMQDIRPQLDDGGGEAEKQVGSQLAPVDQSARSVHAAPGKSRTVWDNPILWREVCTWAYGKKVLLVRLAYAAVFAACSVATVRAISAGGVSTEAGVAPASIQPVAPLLALGLVLVNALAVTSLTNERDARALDLLLVTDLTPKEIIFGKLGGIFYNAKEMVVLPLVLCVACWWFGGLTSENLAFSVLSMIVLNAFVAMLGLHAGMTYANSRTAVGVSLGTLLFLMLGTTVCMRMMVAFQTSFNYQLQPFLAFIIGGGVGLFCALGIRNPSGAIATASFLAPWATFYVIVSFLEGNYAAAAMVAVLMYGFATAALLVPALYEFDVATGRTAAKDL